VEFVVAELLEAQQEAELPAVTGFEMAVRLVAQRAVAVNFADPIVARGNSAGAGKFREPTQPMKSLRKL
jgi:hypothetical protein